ncbi:MAG TPA: UPF0182 family protein [Mycobacteriales bacterium]|nr:UPF0182 family protein [Mycobacteriales bacterium]
MAVRPPGLNLPGRPRPLASAVAALLVLLVLAGVFVSLYTDLLWFREAGQGQVFTKVLGTKVLLFFLFGLLMAVVVGVNLTVAYRVRPPFRPLSLEQQNLEPYRVALERYLLPVMLLISALVGLFAGLSASARWQTWLMWRNGQHFGVEDPQFHKDISYFAFTYPFQRWVLGFLLAALVLALLASAITHYLFGGVRLQGTTERVSVAARVHLSVLIGLVVLVKAIGYWLDRYGLVFSLRGVVQGASYTDVHAVLPAKTMLAGIAVLCALLFFANIVARNVLLPAGALALLVVSAVVVGGIYPAYVQQFRVKPNEVVREAPYIQRNIEATRTAYQIDGVDVDPYSAVSTASKAALRGDKGTLPNARLLDPNKLGPTFKQLQGVRNYFGFNDSLDVDRYTVNGATQDYVVGTRELDQSQLRPDQQNWINLHLTYTHGNGFVAAPANRVTNEGKPVFTVGDIPVAGPGGDLTIDRPQVYYGEKSPTYSIVDTKQAEIDGPGSENTDEATIHYDGPGGVQLDSGLRKLLYALKFKEKNILLSSSLTGDSRIMYIRSPKERVQKLAPFLTLDSDPYPAVVDRSLVWVVDGYTTSSGYPYAQRTQLGEVTLDSRGVPVANEEVNYIRNSVKATVDAYTGKVRLYTWDDKDPVLKTWKKVFPGLVVDGSEMNAQLRAHLRYPEDFFKAQRQLLGAYHVTNPTSFYNKEDFWEVPDDPTNEVADILNGVTTSGSANSGGAPQPPYYVLLQLPGSTRPAFSLTSTFVARGRSNLIAFASVSSDPESYGKIRVLQLPKTTAIPGPGQVANTFESSSDVSKSLSLLRTGGSEVVLGNLLTLPVGNGLLYIEPVYTQAKKEPKFPILNSVIVAFGDQVSYQPTLKQALDALFGSGTTVSPPPTGSPSPRPTPSSGAPLSAIDAAQQAYDDMQAALRAGDFTRYGEALSRLKAALDRASPSPSPAPR